MWQERLKGILVILIAGLVSLAVIRFLISYQEEIVQTTADLRPEKIQENILGAFNKEKGEEDQASEEEVIQPVELIEEKTSELIEEIKKLPQEQLGVVKKEVLKQVCEELMKEKGEINE
jgi:transcription termination factor NusB